MKTRKTLSKIWKDPVWSKVIASLILSGSVYVIYQCLQVNVWIILLLGLVIILLLFILCERYCYSENDRKEDNWLFNRIKDELLPLSAIDYLREVDFGYFFFDKLEPVYSFEHLKKKPHTKFFHSKLERQKNRIIDDITSYKEIILPNTFATEPDGFGVPIDWKDSHPEKYRYVKQELNERANRICADYDKFIKIGRGVFKGIE